MKLLFDENLSPRLVRLLGDAYPNSAHVHDCGLSSANEDVIWEYAKSFQFAIVSKDVDFEERSTLLGFPPKIIVLRVGNCSSATVAELLREFRGVLEEFDAHDHSSYTVISDR